MDDVKDKVKGLMKKVNNPFSSPTGKFKGQGRVLGSSSSSDAAATATSSSSPRPHPIIQSIPKPTSQPPVRSSPKPPDRNPPAGFDPFDPLISTRSRSANGCSLTLFDCPVCARSFPSEDDVSAHLDTCLTEDAAAAQPQAPSDVAGRVAAFMSGKPAEGSAEVVLRLLRNVARDPGNEKFRRIRMSNPKIKEALGEAKGGVELLECVGFGLGDDGGEVWATMEAPSEEQMALLNEAVSLLETWKPEDLKLAVGSVAAESRAEPKKIDRQVRVFFSVPENVAAKIDQPDSFYNLSSGEVKREADMRKKKMAESQLLIPRSFKEKQALTARKKYKLTVIRIQFPDGIVLQGVFQPWEPTTMLYEFVSSAVKEGMLEFDLLRPALPKPRVIPRALKAGERAPTLEEEDLVPSALVKFKPMETDSIVFTGLSNELLEASEPLTSTAAADS